MIPKKVISLTILFCVYSAPYSYITSSPNHHFLADLNRTCINNETCVTTNSFCKPPLPTEKEGRCSCLPSHFPYTTADQDCEGGDTIGTVSCLQIVDFRNETCHVDEQCQLGEFLEHSYCSDGNCHCFPNASYYDSNYLDCSLILSNLGDSCDYGVQCQNIPFADCIRGQCACESGRVASELYPDTCIVAARHLGDSCVNEPAECHLLLNTKCEDEDSQGKTCQCIDHTLVPNEDKTGCLAQVLHVGEPCNETVQCQFSHGVCLDEPTGSRWNGTCRCAVGYFEFSQDTCLSIAQELNANCSEDIQCIMGLGEYSECVGNKCQCKSNGFLRHTTCYPYVSLGEQCMFPEQCGANSSITPDGDSLSCLLSYDDPLQTPGFHRCRCSPESHREYDGICYKTTGYGLPCTSHEQCMASSEDSSEQMVCLADNNTCGCSEEYMINKAGEGCIKMSADLGARCEESAQCNSGNDSNQFCNHEAGICECKKGYEDIEGEYCRDLDPSTDIPTTVVTSDTNSTTHGPVTTPDDATTSSTTIRTTSTTPARSGNSNIFSLEINVLIILATGIVKFSGSYLWHCRIFLEEQN